MQKPFFQRRFSGVSNRGERGVTMVLVAVAMVAIVAMAALSIDVVTLYVSREEAQRAADAGALAAARIISISGMTGTGSLSDTIDWGKICGGTTSLASLAAQSAAQQNGIGGIAPGTVNVTYSVGSGSTSNDCTSLSFANPNSFAINPEVSVQVTRGGLPTLFSRIWSRSANSVSATAVAEAFNPSDSGALAANSIPVAPRCVKPWIIANQDPKGSGPLISDVTTGQINSSMENIVINNSGNGIGEQFTLRVDPQCSGTNCYNAENNTVPVSSYIPARVNPPAVAVASGCAGDDYENAIAGCDESSLYSTYSASSPTTYACGVTGGTTEADLTINPAADTSAGIQCVTGMPGPGNDTLDVGAYPFQIKAGSNNPIIPTVGQVITASNSIMTLPIYDGARLPRFRRHPQVNIVGYLQIFVTNVDNNGNITANLLNISGCGTSTGATPAPGTSPVPIRLITPP